MSRWIAATGIPLLFVPRFRGSDGMRDSRLVLPNVAVGVVKFSVLVLATQRSGYEYSKLLLY